MRYSYDNERDGEDGPEEIEHFFEEMGGNQEQLNNVVELELGHRDLNQQLLEKAVEIAKKSFFWKFYGLPKKLRIIKELYQGLVDILQGK